MLYFPALNFKENRTSKNNLSTILAKGLEFFRKFLMQRILISKEKTRFLKKIFITKKLDFENFSCKETH